MSPLGAAGCPPPPVDHAESHSPWPLQRATRSTLAASTTPRRYGSTEGGGHPATPSYTLARLTRRNRQQRMTSVRESIRVTATVRDRGRRRGVEGEVGGRGMLPETRIFCVWPKPRASSRGSLEWRNGVRLSVVSGGIPLPPALPVDWSSARYSRNLLTMGRRQSLPKARGVILMPMAPCRRLYSLRSTMAITRFTVAASKPRATMSATPWSPST